MLAEASLRPFVVLLVDDDLRTTRRMADMLREDGFSVEIARDGAAAVARLSRAPTPDALLTELTIAHADGVAVARFARAQRPGLPVLVLTGYPNLFNPVAIPGEPPALLFTKPVEYAAVYGALSNALRPSATSVGLDLVRPRDSNAVAELESPREDESGDPVPGAQALRALRRP